MEEHRERVGAATKAVTLGDLRSLVGDLQSDGDPVPALQEPDPRQVPIGMMRSSAARSGKVALTAALLAGLLLGVGIGWGIYGDTGSPFQISADPGAKPDGVAPVVLTPPTQLHSVGGLTGLMDQARKRFGNVVGYRMVIYPTYASFERPDPADDRRMLDSTYRGGWDDPTNRAKNSGDGTEPADLSRFDVPTVVGVMRGAPDTLRIKRSEVKNTYLIIEPADNPVTPGALTLSVYVSSDYGSGYIAFAGDGTVKQINLPS